MTDRGAHFHRSDFQVHTPRDAAWKGARPTTPTARQQWADDFVAACRAKGLDAVAITDHHDFVFAPYVRDAASRETDLQGKILSAESRLTVFPGLELTLAVPCQALFILDADFPSDRLPDILTLLNIEAFDSSEPKLPETHTLEHIVSLAQLQDLLDQREWLRHRYIILPNVTDDGYKTLLRKGMSPKYKEMPCLGGYLDGSFEKLGAGNTDIVTGKHKTWGSKAIGIFQTSDARTSDFVNVGKHSTWVKWAYPTAEALRQACLARQTRISQSEPSLPTIRISRLVVSNSKFMGPIDLSFNPQYNVLIGGRGTGKSTILDYLRWALCDLPAVVADSDEMPDPTARQRRLVEATLADFKSHVEVHFSINHIPHMVRRYSESGEVHLKVGDNDLQKVREADIHALLPVHAYSQKQLSSVSVRLEELTRFVNSPIQRRLDAIDDRVTEAEGRIRENYATLQRYRTLEATIDRLLLNERSLTQQATNLRASLGDLSVEDRKILDSKPAHDLASAAVQQLNRQVQDVLAGAQRIPATVDQVLSRLRADQVADPANDTPPLDIAESVRELRLSASIALEEFGAEAAAAVTKLEASLLQGSYAQKRSIAEALLEAFDRAYDDVKTKSSSHEAQLSELADIERRQRATTSALQEQRAEFESLGNPKQAHTALRSQFLDLHRERTATIADQCVSLSAQSGGLLRATLRVNKGLSAVDKRLRALAVGSGIRGTTFDRFFNELSRARDLLATWELALGELETLMLADPDVQLTSERTPTLSRLGLTLLDQRKLAPQITPDSWLDLALTAISDEPSFEYQTKEGEFIDFAAASAGQQATALLRALLAQGGMPLIIDQPEEDLDSEVMEDVVERIWLSKVSRQLIFSSHNANLVVNGDADLVAVCAYHSVGDQSRGHIKAEGAIDVPIVRQHITQVMEGGEKAFRLRQEKYGF